MADTAVKIPFQEAAAPSTPASTKVVIYAKSDGLMYSKDDAGTETLMSSGGGSGIPATIFDAKGDIIAATAADTAARVAVGANGLALVARSSATPGIAWEVPSGGVLGVTQYIRGTDGAILTTSSTSLVDVDSTNAIVTFTAPVSTNVLVHVECFANSGAANYIKLGLRESSSDIAGPNLVVNSSAAGGRANSTFYLTGISAGSHTYKLAASASTASNVVVSGGPLFGSVLMVVTAV